MRRLQSRIAFRVSGSVCLLFALLILMLPLQWIFAAVIAAAFHELCHYFAVKICGGEIMGMHVGQQGMQMQALSLTAGRELFCILAGPLGSLSLMLLVRFIPRVAFCAAVHGIYNLLPLLHLDGGQALYVVLRAICPVRAQKVVALVQTGILIVLWILTLYFAFAYRFGIIPLIFMLSITMTAKKYLANMA